ncbi:LANO_0E13212g1_1 [Lachancea nothofagi CBS 11611]|uniref:ATPase expression protein 1 n=1 Tax=Lachancea nothofagi CBS 11611 TaxID=1266666 RepID=A0A1G4JYQ1_9SACH|nr:LANO_0E13212g1_1 [Lachancea nothofagi CBS 11611]
MSIRKLPPKRLFSTLNESIIAKNPHKNLDNGTFRRFPRIIPEYDESIHPFYLPNSIERALLCASESTPQLLEGRKIVPSIIKRPRDQKSALVNARWLFDSVVEANEWLNAYRTGKSLNQKNITVLRFHDADKVLRRSHLNQSQVPQIKQFASLFMKKDADALNCVMITNMVESMMFCHETKLFSEEVFLYILQHYCNSRHGIIGVVQSIVNFLQKDIDDMSVAEVLLLQVLTTIKEKNIPADPQVTSALLSLTDAISERFHRQNCIFDFSPAVVQAILEFYLASGLLNESKILFTDLINKRLCPEPVLVERYLALVDQKVDLFDSHDSYLKRFAYISDFKPVFETAMTPRMVEFLITYCRHFDELISLLDMIDQSKLRKQIWDQTLPDFIRRVNLLDTRPVVNSCNLSVLLQRAKGFYGLMLSNKVNRAFIVQYAANQNFSVVTNLINGQEQQLNPNFYASLLNAQTQKVDEQSSPLPGFRPEDKRYFIESVLIPHYNRLSVTAKFIFLEQAETEDLFEALLRSESNSQTNDGKSMISEILARAKDRGMTSLLTRYAA